jgi:hypothetical protein
MVSSRVMILLIQVLQVIVPDITQRSGCWTNPPYAKLPGLIRQPKRQQNVPRHMEIDTVAGINE